MKNRLTTYHIFILVLLTAALLSGSVSYFSMKSQMYKYEFYDKGTLFSQVRRGLVTPGQVREANSILEKIPHEQYEEKRDEFVSEIYRLDQYAIAISQPREQNTYYESGYIRLTKDDVAELRNSYSYTVAEAEYIAKKLNLCVCAISYAVNASGYGGRVRTRAEKMLKFDIFNGASQKMIAKTGADFFETGDVRITAYISAGIEKLMVNPYGMLFAVAAAFICALCRMSVSEKAGDVHGRSREYFFLSVFTIGCALIFACEFFAAGIVYGFGDLTMSIQSVPAFISSRYRMELWQLLLLRSIFNTLCVLLIYMLSCLVLRGKQRLLKAALTIAACFAALYFLKGSPLDIRCFRHFENIVGVYGNMVFCGIVFSHAQVFIAETIVLFTVVVLLYRKQSMRLAEELETEVERAYLDEINEKNLRLRVLRHDMKNHFTAILLLLNESREEEAREYLHSLIEDVSKTAVSVETGCKALDMLLWNKAAIAKEKGITLVMELKDDYSEVVVSDYELCSLYGNLLDNAIEATSVQKDSAKRISLRSARQKDMSCVFCENPYTFIKTEGKRFVTTKDTPSEHGIGIRAMERIAAKHGGCVDIKMSDGIFSVSILMHLSI